MGDIAFNISKASAGYLATLPASADALIVVPLEASGLEADAVLQDYDTLAALLAGASNEQTTIGRKALTGVTVTVDDTNDRVDIGADDVTWTAATGNALGALVICYDPDTGTGTDADLIPLCKQDYVATPSGGDLSAQMATFLRFT